MESRKFCILQITISINSRNKHIIFNDESGIKRDLKNKKGSFGFRIIEPFNKNKIFRSDLDGEFFSQSQ